MDENLHRDPLEDLFRKNLEDQNLDERDAANDGWDLPSDNLWDKIGGAVSPTPPPPSNGFWLSNKMLVMAIAATVVIATGVIIGFMSYQNKVTELTQRVEELSAPREEGNIFSPKEESLLSPVDQKIISTKVEEEGTETFNENSEASMADALIPGESENRPAPEDKRTTAKENNTTINLDSPNNSGTDSRLKNKANKNDAPDISDSSNTQKEVESNSRITESRIIETAKDKNQQVEILRPIDRDPVQPANPDKNQLIANEKESSQLPSTTPKLNADLLANKNPQKENTDIFIKKSWTALPPLTTKSIVLLEIAKPSISPKMAQPPIITPLRNPSNRGLYAGLLYAPSTTILSIKAPNRNSPKPDLFTKGKSINSNTGGLKLGYQINKHWSVEMEGRYGTSKISSGHPVRLKYSRQKEREIEPGRYQGDYSSSIPTAYGDIQADISLFRASDTDVPEQSDILVNLKSTQSIDLLSIPVAARYSIGNGPLRLTIKAGLAANIILKDSTTITATAINRKGLTHNRTKVISSQRSNLKNNADLLLGLGLDYQITPNWRFSLEPNFNQALSPIFQDARLKTLPKKVSVSLGVNYHF